MAQAGRNAYGEEMRRRAVRILSEGAGHRSLARELGIPDATARQWARSYAVGGQAAVMNAEMVVKRFFTFDFTKISLRVFC